MSFIEDVFYYFIKNMEYALDIGFPAVVLVFFIPLFTSAVAACYYALCRKSQKYRIWHYILVFSVFAMFSLLVLWIKFGSMIEGSGDAADNYFMSFTTETWIMFGAFVVVIGVALVYYFREPLKELGTKKPYIIGLAAVIAISLVVLDWSWNAVTIFLLIELAVLLGLPFIIEKPTVGAKEIYLLYIVVFGANVFVLYLSDMPIGVWLVVLSILSVCFIGPYLVYRRERGEKGGDML